VIDDLKLFLFSIVGENTNFCEKKTNETVKRYLKGVKFTPVACNYRVGHCKVITSLAKAI